MTPRLILCLSVSIALCGCIDPARFDPEMRAQCFDTLWNALETGHADVDAVARARTLRPEFRERVIDADTRREYIVELARFLAAFDDVHLGFDDLDAWWKTRTGRAFSSLISTGVWLGGHIYVEFSTQAAAAQSEWFGGSITADRFYELVTVDGIPADRMGVLPLVFSLLRGEPGTTATVTLRVDGVEETQTLIFPELAEIAPTSAPARPARRKPESKRTSLSAVTSQRLDNNVGYIWLGDLTSEATVIAFHAAIDALLDTQALILDLRDNHGGTRGPIESVLSRFVTGVRTYASAQARVPRLLPIGSPIWWLGFQGYVWSREPVYHRPLVVLIDATTLSSAEILASALRELCGATLVGERTIGAGAAVATVTLPDGLAVRYGAFLIRQRDGTAFQGQGIEPDIAVPVDVEAVRRGGMSEMRRWGKRVAGIGYVQALLKAGVVPDRRGQESQSQPATAPAALP